MKISKIYKAKIHSKLTWFIFVFCFTWSQVALSAVTETSSSSKKKLVTVANPIKETSLNTVVLSEEVEKRLGVTISKVQTKAVVLSRTYNGEIVVPGDRALTIQAPFTGTVKMNGKLPRPGDSVKKGQVIMELVPILTPEAKTNLEITLTDMYGEIKNAETQQSIAEIAFVRAKQLYEDKAGSKRNMQEAQAAYDQANASLKALQQRQRLITGALGRNATAKSVLTAPADGILTILSAQPEQVVSAGTVLFTVANQKKVWTRTAVPVGDIGQILDQNNAIIQNFSNQKAPRYTAAPVMAPPSSALNTMTVDVYHELNNENAGFIPGQRVSVELKMKSQSDYATIPWRSVIFDIYGNTWVYERIDKQTYSRKRVIIDHVSDSDAAIQQGPRVGKDIVNNGAQELFALETGYTK